METENKGYFYHLQDNPPFWECVLIGIQHMFAIFAGIIAPPLIICGALKMDIQTTAYLVSMALFISGISTFIQIYQFKCVGSGLLSIQGTSFSFIGPIIAAGKTGGLSLIFGTCLAGCTIEIILSRFLHLAKKIITPLVSGIVVLMIGLSLIKIAFINCAGGFGAQSDGTFGESKYWIIAGIVVGITIILNQVKNRYLKMSSLFSALIIGSIIAWFNGFISLDKITDYSLFTLPVPFKYGMSFDFSTWISISIIYLITSIETIGDITATSLVSREPIQGDLYMKRISGGVLADGINSGLAAIFNSFPNTTFSQNNGVIQITGVASRKVGYFISVMLVLMGLFPLIGNFVSLIPAPVIGGATLILFGTVASAGIKILTNANLDQRGVLILSVSLGLGMGVLFVPEALTHLPDGLKNILSSGITTGGMTALLLNTILPEKNYEEK